MLSKTLSDGLESYGIGAKIRVLRTRKGLGLEQLGKHSGLSAGMLSKIERGQIFPTLPTLLRIAMIFGVGLDHFFTDEDEQPVVAVVRSKDRMLIPAPDTDTPSYFFESLDFPATNRKVETYRAEFVVSDTPSEPHSHGGAEVVYVISGGLDIAMNGDVHSLESGDSIYFDAGYDHSYQCRGDRACSAIVVVAPGTA